METIIRQPFACLISLILLMFMMACTPRADRSVTSPSLEWDASQQTLIIQVSQPSDFPGVVPGRQVSVTFENYIPIAQVWGDGRIVWVTYQPETGSRRVLEGQLSRAEMVSLLQRIVDTGFFSEQAVPGEQGDIPQAKSAPPAGLYLRLRTLERHYILQDSELADFNALHKFLGSGAGAQGKPYQPERGRLCVYPQASRVQPPSLHWPDGLMGFKLANRECRMLQDQALQFAWDTVNRSPAAPLVESQGATFLLTLQVPGLTLKPIDWD